MNVSEMTLLRTAGIDENSPLNPVLAGRSNIIEMTQQAEDAVLRPGDAGAISHALRAAIAARVARQAKDETLAQYYLAAAADLAPLADPAATGDAQGLSHIIAFVDLTANETRDVAAADIATLQTAGVADADIVRLCELVAFLAYQLRVVSGLRLMQEGQS